MRSFYRKIILAGLLVISFACMIDAFGQNNPVLKAPDVTNVQKIEMTDNTYRFQTPASLRRMLPHLTAHEVNGTKPVYPKCQYGTITLNDGTVLKWYSTWVNNVAFYDDRSQEFYSDDYSDWAWIDLDIFAYLTFTAMMFLIIYFARYISANPDNRYVALYTRLSDITVVNFLIRIFLLAIYFYLAYLFLLEPYSQMCDGVILEIGGSAGGRSGPSQILFADTQPVLFWLSMFIKSFIGLLSALLGIGLLLLFNPGPKSKMWGKPSK